MLVTRAWEVAIAERLNSLIVRVLVALSKTEQLGPRSAQQGSTYQERKRNQCQGLGSAGWSSSLPAQAGEENEKKQEGRADSEERSIQVSSEREEGSTLKELAWPWIGGTKAKGCLLSSSLLGNCRGL